jgi:NAD(P)-dependent dehydrogenase (short-subunit alcohol dehydrogenase family)
LRDAEAELRGRSVPVYAAVCDVGTAEALDGFLQAARATLGGVDILVNNPSRFVFSDDQSAWESTLNVDLMAAVRSRRRVGSLEEETRGANIRRRVLLIDVDRALSTSAYLACQPNDLFG